MTRPYITTVNAKNGDFILGACTERNDAINGNFMRNRSRSADSSMIALTGEAHTNCTSHTVYQYNSITDQADTLVYQIIITKIRLNGIRVKIKLISILRRTFIVSVEKASSARAIGNQTPTKPLLTRCTAIAHATF